MFESVGYYYARDRIQRVSRIRCAVIVDGMVGIAVVGYDNHFIVML